MGTPNQIISTPPYTWYGYVTRIQSNYPVKYNFSELAPHCPIAIPVPLSKGTPRRSSSPCGCSVWFKADNWGTVKEVRYEGKHCADWNWMRPVGN